MPPHGLEHRLGGTAMSFPGAGENFSRHIAAAMRPTVSKIPFRGPGSSCGDGGVGEGPWPYRWVFTQR